MYAFKKRGVAQLVARSVRDAEVVGSIPVASTKNTVKPCGCTVFFVFCDSCEKSRITVGSRDERPNVAINLFCLLVGARKLCLLADPRRLDQKYGETLRLHRIFCLLR